MSPGSAPSTAIGPLTWSTRSKSRRAEVVDGRVAVSWPPLASRQSNVTMLPDGTVAIGGIAGSQARWNRSRVTWNADAAVANVPSYGISMRPSGLIGNDRL